MGVIIGLLLSPLAVTGTQGSASIAKTIPVLATYAGAARDQGFEVGPLAPTATAPTATAATVLGKAIGTKHMTVARMLSPTGTIACGDRKPVVWLVD